METEYRGQHPLQEQQQMHRQQQVANPAGNLAITQFDHDFFTRVWEAQGHAFGD